MGKYIHIELLAPPPNLNTNGIPDSTYQTEYIMLQNNSHAILFSRRKIPFSK